MNFLKNLEKTTVRISALYTVMKKKQLSIILFSVIYNIHI